MMIILIILTLVLIGYNLGKLFYIASKKINGIIDILKGKNTNEYITPGTKELNSLPIIEAKINKNTSNIIKGEIGENNIYTILKSISATPYYTKNLYIDIDENKSCEIDLLYIHKTGIYVFESKNLNGWIFGKEDDKNWTQTLFEEKYSFYNPIKQNESHIENLKKLLKIDDSSYFHSYIIFGEKTTLKSIKVNTIKNKILKINDFKNTLINDLNKNEIKLSNQQIEYFWSIIMGKGKYVGKIEDTHKDYVKNIKDSL